MKKWRTLKNTNFPLFRDPKKTEGGDPPPHFAKIRSTLGIIFDVAWSNVRECPVADQLL